MDLGFNEEQEMLRKAARDFLEKECPKTLVRQMEEEERGYSPELWHKMAELGWVGLAFPEQYGGSGFTFLELALLLEEMGRALLPSPFVPTVVYCGLPILKFGTEAQKHQLLPKIANGELIMTLALTEPSARYDAAEVACQAVPDGDGYILSGTKLFVPDAHIADQLLCAARTSEGVEEGITLFLIDAKSPGISCTVLKTFSADKLCEVAFANVPVPRGNILGELDHGWNIVKSIAEHAAVAHCALMLGMVEWVLQASVDYAKERVQFGRPIGALQAVQHKCADMVIDVDGCRFITYQAAWKLSQGLPCTLEVSMAKAWVGEASRRVCIQGHQIHGGIGFTADHDIQLYSRRAMAGELAFGDSDFHREIVAQQLGF